MIERNIIGICKQSFPIYVGTYVPLNISTADEIYISGSMYYTRQSFFFYSLSLLVLYYKAYSVHMFKQRYCTFVTDVIVPMIGSGKGPGMPCLTK